MESLASCSFPLVIWMCKNTLLYPIFTLYFLPYLYCDGFFASNFKIFFIFLCVSLERVDIWIRLHTRMVVILSKFNWMAVVCRKKHENIFKTYKDDKLANGILENACDESKFYEAMDE